METRSKKLLVMEEMAMITEEENEMAIEEKTQLEVKMEEKKQVGLEDLVKLISKMSVDLDEKLNNKFREQNDSIKYQFELYSNHVLNMNSKIDLVEEKCSSVEKELHFVKENVLDNLDNLKTDMTNNVKNIQTLVGQIEDNTNFEILNIKKNLDFEKSRIDSQDFYVTELNKELLCKIENQKKELEGKINKIECKQAEEHKQIIINPNQFSGLNLGIFNGFERRPIDFFKQCKLLYFQNQENWEVTKIMIGSKLEKMASLWFKYVEDDLSNFNEFEEKFKSQFWNTDVQDKILENFIMGKCFRGANMQTYFLDKINTNKELDKPLTPTQLIRYITKHFGVNIQEQIMLKGYETYEEVLRYLRKMDEWDNLRTKNNFEDKIIKNHKDEDNKRTYENSNGEIPYKRQQFDRNNNYNLTEKRKGFKTNRFYGRQSIKCSKNGENSTFLSELDRKEMDERFKKLLEVEYDGKKNRLEIK